MRVVALVTMRNEEPVLGRCLAHLVEQGVSTVLIDDGSTDRSRAIGESFLGRGVDAILDHPYPGFFDLLGMVRLKETIAARLDADWFLNTDPDEIREAPPGMGSLAGAFERVAAAGYNAVNFDEFVFLPAAEDGSFEGTDFVATMRHYYFFAPEPSRRVNAWRGDAGPVDLTGAAGHRVEFPGRRIFPESFVLRHYIALSRAHALRKYGERLYSESEVREKNWHGPRARFDPARLAFPPRALLRNLDRDGWDRSDPWPRHTFFGDAGPV